MAKDQVKENEMEENQFEDISSFEFDYDEGAAKLADRAADRLTDGGAYVGSFKVVSPFKSEKGTIGTQFDVVLKDGGETNFGLFLVGQDGKELFGMQNFQGIRAVMGLKGRAKPSKGMVRKYNKEAKAWEDAEGPVYADMMDKEIGMVLQKELYTKQGGGDGVRFNLVTVYDPKTRLTPREIIAGEKVPKRLDKVLKGLTDKDSRTVKNVKEADLGIDTGDLDGI